MQSNADRMASIQERLNLLQTVAGTTFGNHSLDAILHQHVTHVCNVFRADFCVMRKLVDDQLVLLASHGIEPSNLLPSIESTLGITHHLIQNKAPIGVPDVQNHPIALPSLISQNKVEFISYAGTPMICNDVVIGILGVFYRKDHHEYSKDDLLLLQALGNSLAVAIKNHEMFSQLQDINEDLDQRVKTRTSELESANRELEAFTYTVAHDLRTPLRAIVSNSQILIEDFEEALPLEAKALLNRQAVAAKRLATMMDGLLSLTRIGKVDVQKAQMNLSRLAEEVALEFIRANPACPPKFTIEPDILIAADSRLIRTLLQNLFENSVKFAKPNQPAVVRLRKCKKDSDVTFIVEDEGIGFEMEYSAKVFQPFERLVREEDYPGTGIGLASVKRVVDKHRGLVQVDSRPGEGAAFTFRL